MKTNSKYIVISALITLALTTLGLDSCVKDQFDESLGDLVTITLTAENPGFASDAAPASKSVVGDSIATPAASFAPVELDSTATLEESIAALGDRVVYSDSTMYICAPQGMAPDTKTGMTTDGTPFWEPGDKIGLITKTGSKWYNALFINKRTKPSQATTFEGKISKAPGYAFAYYPYISSLPKQGKVTDAYINLNILDLQKPLRPGSFDGNADIMMAQVSPNPEAGNSYDGAQLKFRRKVGFMKFSLFDKAHKPLNKPINSITITSSSNIVGAVKLMLHADHEAEIITSNGKKVTVQYPGGQGSREIFAAVCPQDLSGVTLTIEGTTTDGKFGPTTKEIPAGNSIAENMYTFFGIVVETGGEVTPPTPDPDPIPGVDIPNDNAWLNFTRSNEAMSAAKQAGNMDEYNRILSERILLDYSYAGYMHGTAVPPTRNETTWKTYNIKNYYTNEKGRYDSSDRHAFLRALKAAGMITYNDMYKVGKPIPNATANAIFYFPERLTPYVLHDDTDDAPSGGWNGNPKSNAILLNAGNFMIVGDGPSRTMLEMATVNYPTSGAKYSSPEMILVKNPDVNTVTRVATVTEDAVRGSDYVITDNAVNGWVILCLDVKGPGQELLNYELGGHAPVDNGDDTMLNIKSDVIVRDFHKVKSCEPNPAGSGYKVTFMEPVMREINLARDGHNWTLATYHCYENVGVENLTFVGHAKADFTHHASWQDDGGFKPLTFTGLVNSWIRNVNFESITECVSLKQCANCSAYEIEISGNRGHAGIRSAGSSRIFLGNIYDHSAGFTNVDQQITTTREKSAGQYHASGVSKPSMGAVLWRNQWGTDATFESHSGQPRATLVDHCKGGWVEKRFGGDRSDIPNHLGDLCIWNMEAVTYRSPTFVDAGYNSGKFQFWYDGPDKLLWRVTPPIIVGFHGAGNVDFDQLVSAPGNPGQMKYKESMGQKVATESLYEAQLQERITREGISSAWLNYLQLNTPTFR